MAEQTSPFTGLDKALLRSTSTAPAQAQPSAAPSPMSDEATRPPRKARSDTGTPTHAPIRARTRASVHARTYASTGSDLVTDLYQHLQRKQRLASSTYRFRPEELAELDNVYAQLVAAYPGKVSKNDLVRLGVHWLLADYEDHGDESVLALVLART